VLTLRELLLMIQVPTLDYILLTVFVRFYINNQSLYLINILIFYLAKYPAVGNDG
jgi:hypothetical protein